MYPETPTHTEELIQLIEQGAPIQKDIIKEYIENHDTSKAVQGEKYYFKENDITKRVIYKYTNEGTKVIDLDATNNKLASGWHKLLVDQKTSYLVGQPVTVGYKDETDIEPLMDIVGDEFEDTLPELVKDVSNKGREYLHPYIDEEGNFDYMIVPMQEFIPIYDNTKKRKMVAGIRYYALDDEVYKVELWTDKNITYYEMINGEIYLDATREVNPAPHFEYNGVGYGWERVPYIEFKNNTEAVSDLIFYKDLIDAYDKLDSDSMNSLEDIQQFLYAIRGYEGTDIEQAVTNFKRFKGVAVDENGGVDIVQGDIPMDSVNSFLDRLKEDIFAFGQGVDVNPSKLGGNQSGVSLKFLFSLLDMKSEVLERKFVKSLKQFFWFVTEYASIANIGDYDYQKLTFTFNKSTLMNNFEAAQIAQMSKGIISDTSIIENHPWVKDAQVEKDRLDEQNEGSVNLDIPLEGGEDE